MRAIIGDSTNTYDTSLSPSDNNHDWLITSTSPGTTNSALAVDITALGGLTGGRVQLIVTDKGAGVRNLGTIYASAGDVVVSTLGDIGVVDGSIKAENTIQITTPGAFSLQGTQMSAANDVTLSANGITLVDDPSGGSTTLSAQNGAVKLTSTGDINNTGSLIQAGAIAANGTAVGGDVTLSATGNILNRSSAANLGVVFAANGQTSLSAQGDITNENGRILSNGKTSVTAQGDVSTSSTTPTAPTAASRSPTPAPAAAFCSSRTTPAASTSITASSRNRDNSRTSRRPAGAVTISGRNVTNSGGIIQSNDASVTITAQQAFTNAAVFSGQASYARSCWIFCHASASSNVMPNGGTIQAGTDIAISAGTVASNIGGNVFAAGNIAVSAPVTYAQGVTGYSAINQDRGFKAFFGSTWAQIIAERRRRRLHGQRLGVAGGSAVIDGGYITGSHGVSASGA